MTLMFDTKLHDKHLASHKTQVTCLLRSSYFEVPASSYNFYLVFFQYGLKWLLSTIF